MVVGTMATAQAPGMTCPRSGSRSFSGHKLQQPVVVVARVGFPGPWRMDSALRLGRPSYSIGAGINLHSGLSSSFCGAHVKAGRKGLGNLWRRRVWEGRVRCQVGGASSSQEDEAGSDASVPSTSDGNDTVQFDLNLPRRSALLEFTCNVCQARTQRMINPDAFRRGTVYVQCGGCEVYHQLVDNLNLVKEYDFKNEVDPMRNDLGV